MNNEPKSRPLQDEPLELDLSQVIRQELWTSHACEGKYGDDGEMQCNKFFPMIDFKRDFPSEILAKCSLHRLQRIEAYQKVSPPAAQPESQHWETFCDSSYYDMCAVRPVGENRWGRCFHVPSKDEATALVEILNAVPIAQPESQPALDEDHPAFCNLVCADDLSLKCCLAAGHYQEYHSDGMTDWITSAPSSRVAGGVGGEEKGAEEGDGVFIGTLRRELFMSYDCKWNGYVRDITAELEKDEKVSRSAVYARIFSDTAKLMTANETFRDLSKR